MDRENEWGGHTGQYEHYQLSPYTDADYEEPVQDLPKNKKRGSGKKSPVRKILWCMVSGCVFGLFAAGVFLLVIRGGITLTETGAEDPIYRQVPPLQETEMLPEEIVDEGIPEVADADEEITETVKKHGVVAGVAQAAMPSIVAITSVSIQEIPSYFGFGFGYGYREYPSTGSGSGIIVGENEEELLIATNNHVVEGASTLSVCFIGNDVVNAEKETEAVASGYGDINVENAISAKVKGTDADNDLAVIAVQKSDIPQDTMSQIKIAKLNDTDEPVVGEQVIAIGNALGYGQSLTVGYISALNRSFTSSGGETASGLIQTDAAINPGNSGGALLNMQGEVIGINSAKSAANAVEGVGYAIPIAKARPILEELMNRKTRDLVTDASEAAFMGVAMADISTEAMQMYSVPAGAFIARVYSGSPADQAGLLQGDVIEKLDGQKVSDREDLLNRLQYYSAGEEVELLIARPYDGVYQEETLMITLGSKSDYNY